MPRKLEIRRLVVAYQVGDGPAHGSDLAGSYLRDEVDEPMPLVAAVAAHRHDYRPHPVDWHGIRHGVCQRDKNHYGLLWQPSIP